MHFSNYLTCLWPGLSELWWRGRLSALPLAIGFALAFNALLVMRYLYPTWVDPWLIGSAWWIGTAMWGVWTIKSMRALPELLQPRDVSQQPDRFPEAQQAFLSEQWELAEQCLLTVLEIEPRDPPALLLLSGVYRHTERAEYAAALMQELQRLEVAADWEIEIQAEAERVQRWLELQAEQTDRNQLSDGEAAEDEVAADEVAADEVAASEEQPESAPRSDSSSDPIADEDSSPSVLSIESSRGQQMDDSSTLHDSALSQWNRKAA